MSEELNHLYLGGKKITQEDLDDFVAKFVGLRAFKSESAKREAERSERLSKAPHWHGLDGNQQAQFLEELVSGPERSAAILAGAFLDNLLSQLLRSRMVSESRHVIELIDGGPNSLSFYAKITLAFGLGLITEDERFNLDRIRRIRNAFAHDMFRHSFESDQVKDWTLSLRIAQKENDSSSRTVRMTFAMAVAQLVREIGLRTEAAAADNGDNV